MENDNDLNFDQRLNIEECNNDNKKKLFVDVLYFHWFTFERRIWELEPARRKIREFVAAARKDYELEAFIGDVFADEDESAWKEKREEEIERCFRKNPEQLQVLQGDLFTEAKVPVRYCVDPIPHTIMSHALATNAVVLSGRIEMFGFTHQSTPLSIPIYKDFKIVKGLLQLVPLEVPKAEMERIEVPRPLPTNPRSGFFSRRIAERKYSRGSPSPLTKRMGNIYLLVRPLRQAAYHRLGIESVEEEFPVWNSDRRRVDWLVERVPARFDQTMDQLLDDDVKAVEHFKKKCPKPREVYELFWINHIFALTDIVCKIIWAVHDDRSLLQMLDRNLDTSNYDAVHRDATKEFQMQCVDCRKGFPMTKGEMDLFKEIGLPPPKRCQSCRNRRKRGGNRR